MVSLLQAISAMLNGKNVTIDQNVSCSNIIASFFISLSPQVRQLENQQYLNQIIEYEIIGEGSQISTNQKPGNSAFSPLIG